MATIRSRQQSPSSRRRWSVVSRSLAAIVGGYVVISLINLAVPLLFGASGFSVPEALVGTLMASFLVWALIVMAAFHARSAGRVWFWLIGAAVPLGIIVWVLLPAARP